MVLLPYCSSLDLHGLLSGGAVSFLSVIFYPWWTLPCVQSWLSGHFWLIFQRDSQGEQHIIVQGEWSEHFWLIFRRDNLGGLYRKNGQGCWNFFKHFPDCSLFLNNQPRLSRRKISQKCSDHSPWTIICCSPWLSRWKISQKCPYYAPSTLFTSTVRWSCRQNCLDSAPSSTLGASSSCVHGKRLGHSLPIFRRYSQGGYCSGSMVRAFLADFPVRKSGRIVREERSGQCISSPDSPSWTIDPD